MQLIHSSGNGPWHSKHVPVEYRHRDINGQPYTITGDLSLQPPEVLAELDLSVYTAPPSEPYISPSQEDLDRQEAVNFLQMNPLILTKVGNFLDYAMLLQQEYGTVIMPGMDFVDIEAEMENSIPDPVVQGACADKLWARWDAICAMFDRGQKDANRLVPYIIEYMMENQ